MLVGCCCVTPVADTPAPHCEPEWLAAGVDDDGRPAPVSEAIRPPPEDEPVIGGAPAIPALLGRSAEETTPPLPLFPEKLGQPIEGTAEEGAGTAPVLCSTYTLLCVI